MGQMAKVTEKMRGKYDGALYRLSGPYDKEHLDETEFAEPGETLPERPHRWEAWVHENFDRNELIEVRLCLPGCGGFEYKTQMSFFPEQDTRINLSSGWDKDTIHGEYEISKPSVLTNYCCAYARKVGPVDETKFLHMLFRV